MRLYLGGKMRDLPDFGHALFDHAEEILTDMGHNVFNPARYDREHDTMNADVRVCLAADMAWILAHSQGMVVLENWRTSLGAKAEVALHQAVGLPVWEFDDFVCRQKNAPQVARLIAYDSRAGLMQSVTDTVGVA